MKNFLLTTLLLVSFAAANAQMSVGVRGSANFSTVTKFPLIENITPDFRFKVAANSGVFLEIPITESFSVQPELAYNQKGFRVQEGINVAGQFAGVNIPINGTVNFKTHYVELPVLAKFHVGEKTAPHVYFMVGPSVGYLVDAGLRVNVLNLFPVNTGLPTGIFNPVEVSGIAALGTELPVTQNMKIFFETRYQHGFSRILDTPIVRLPVRNRSVSGGFGVKFNLNR